MGKKVTTEFFCDRAGCGRKVDRYRQGFINFTIYDGLAANYPANDRNFMCDNCQADLYEFWFGKPEKKESKPSEPKPDGFCHFVKAWVGRCTNETLPGDLTCLRHEDLKCFECGEQALTECAHTFTQFICGAPQCAKHKHHLDG